MLIGVAHSILMLYHLCDIKQIEPVKGYKVRFVHGQNMTLAYWDVEMGAVLPKHTHPNEQITSVLEGNFVLTVEGTTYSLSKGDVLTIPPNAAHSGKALTDCKILDAFYPVREDYRT